MSHLPIRSKRHKEIGYSLPEAATVRLVVYDVLGRERAVLDEGMRGAGRHALRWDGRGSSGVALGQGVYLVRLVAGSRDEARKLIIAR